MILAAGRGERLRPLTDHTPKPLVMIGEAPLIGHQLSWLASAGIHEVVINLHHLAADIKQVIGNGAHWGVEIRYSLEDELLETGGGIAKALPLLGADPFLILNGDIWTDFPLGSLPTRLGADTLAHLVLTPHPDHLDSGDFGLLDGYVTRTEIRPYTYCGISVIAPALLRGRAVAPFSLREPLFEAITRRQITGEVFDGRWTDIGTPEQLKMVQDNFASSR
jgi:MurNAc alpha-1-phosphate uridylyltransferase